MTERLDEARKYVELYKQSMNKYDTEGSLIYGLRAAIMLTAIHETARNEEEVREAELLEKKMFPPYPYPHLDRKDFIPYLVGKIW